MSEVERLSIEAEKRRAEFEAAFEGLSRRMRPAKLLDDSLGRLGPASEVSARLRRVVRENPWAVAACAASLGWVAWQFLRAGNGLIAPPPAYSTPRSEDSPAWTNSQPKENLNGYFEDSRQASH
jgi:hypothetical protein